MSEELHSNLGDGTAAQIEREILAGFGTYDYDVCRDHCYWSEGIYHVYEYPKDIRPAMTMERMLSHFEDETAKNRKWQLANDTQEKREEYCEEYDIITFAGNRKRIRAAGRRFYDVDGLPTRFIGTIQDIGNVKQPEQEQLTRYVEELRRSNQELEEFAYIASHDLQEPLRKISTFSGRLYARFHDELAGEGSQYIDRIMASAESMRSLIDNLLEFSRIAQGDEPLQPTRLDVVLLGVQSDLELVLEDSGTDLQIAPLPTVMGHPGQLAQLFTNLLSNAVKFRRREVSPEVKIATGIARNERVRAAGLRDSHSFYYISIQDNGIGFEPEYAERIFGAFQRLHGKAEYPGTGIGLAICRKIAERHGGALVAESSPGNGACFTLFLPKQDFPQDLQFQKGLSR